MQKEKEVKHFEDEIYL